LTIAVIAGYSSTVRTKKKKEKKERKTVNLGMYNLDEFKRHSRTIGYPLPLN